MNVVTITEKKEHLDPYTAKAGEKFTDNPGQYPAAQYDDMRLKLERRGLLMVRYHQTISVIAGPKA